MVLLYTETRGNEATDIELNSVKKKNHRNTSWNKFIEYMFPIITLLSKNYLEKIPIKTIQHTHTQIKALNVQNPTLHHCINIYISEEQATRAEVS